jgi:hypothetical protein
MKNQFMNEISNRILLLSFIESSIAFNMSKESFVNWKSADLINHYDENLNISNDHDHYLERKKNMEMI